MDRSDDFYLAWLARDVRFQCSVHFSPKHKLGYSIYRKVYTSKDDCPPLNLWLTERGIHGRILRNREQIRKLLTILEPVWDCVKDRENLERLNITMRATTPRKITHDEILPIIHALDSCPRKKQ